ncbi:MAG: branched-chain amino acid ABC transporter permease [Geminicoccaceae bacterium]
MVPAFSIERSTTASRIGVAAGAVLLVLLVALPFLAGRATLRVAIEIFAYLTLAQMWNLLAGYAGLVSVGQQAFVGFGGYMLFALAVFLGLNPLLALPLAGLLTVLVAIPTAFVVFRLRGAYFAIGTWVVAEVYRLLFAQVGALGGGSGMSLPADTVKMIAANAALRDSIIYWAALALVLVALATVYLLLRSRWGLALTAIRDSEPAAESVGVDIYRTKLVIYLATAGVTGLAGGLIFLQKLRISPDAAFSLGDFTALVIFMTVIGGIGRIEGPIVGTAVFFLMRGLLADLGAWYLMLLGLIAVVVMLMAPKGLWGYLADRFDLQLFPVQRRVNLKRGP